MKRASRFCNNDAMNEDETWRNRISIDPAVATGHPVMTGTRVPVHVILGHLAAGDTVERVREAYNLSDEDMAQPSVMRPTW